MSGVLLASICVISIVATGCSQPGIENPSECVLVPGVGISNRVQVGMTLEEIRRANRDMVLELESEAHGLSESTEQASRSRWSWQRPTRYYNARIPSLGAYFGGLYTTKEVRVYSIDFYTSSSNGVFVGSLPGGITFSQGLPVRRGDIVRVFGEPHESVELGRLARMVETGSSFSVQCPNGSELLYYMTNGVLFDLRTNTVTRVTVFKARGKDSKGHLKNQESER